jgi:hypothetical protein
MEFPDPYKKAMNILQSSKDGLQVQRAQVFALLAIADSLEAIVELTQTHKEA